MCFIKVKKKKGCDSVLSALQSNLYLYANVPAQSPIAASTLPKTFTSSAQVKVKKGLKNIDF